MYEPYQDLGRGLGSRKTGLASPLPPTHTSNYVITEGSEAVLLVRLIFIGPQHSY